MKSHELNVAMLPSIATKYIQVTCNCIEYVGCFFPSSVREVTFNDEKFEPDYFEDDYCYGCSLYYEFLSDEEIIERAGLNYEDFYFEYQYGKACEEARLSINSEDFYNEDLYEAERSKAALEVERDDYESDEDYQEACKEASNNVDREDFFDEAAYERACEEASSDVDREDFFDEDGWTSAIEEWREEYEADSCRGGCSVLFEGGCEYHDLTDLKNQGNSKRSWKVIHHLFLYNLISPSSSLMLMNIEHESVGGLKPLKIGNVYDDGSICWGDTYSDSTCLGLYNGFWDSVFNEDLEIELDTDHDDDKYIYDSVSEEHHLTIFSEDIISETTTAIGYWRGWFTEDESVDERILFSWVEELKVKRSDGSVIEAAVVKLLGKLYLLDGLKPVEVVEAVEPVSELELAYANAS